MAEVISVSALNQYVKTLLDANDLLFDLALRGEIANFVQNARSGHCYFSLRDETSSVKAVMFRSDARRLGFRPEEGMKVIVRCRATLYERDGAFQVYVNDMFPDGIGSAQLAFEQLKAKLDREGLFAAERKKPLPRFPKCIGLVTSKTGAALQDIRNVIGRRWPAVRRRKPGRPLGLQCRAHRAGRIPLQNTTHQRHRSRDRLYDPGLCGRPARPDPIGGGRACRARPGRIFTKIMQFGRKYSHFYPKQAEFML